VPAADGVLRRSAKFTYVSSGYFSTFEIPILGGRDFEDADTTHARKVAIVNETFVRGYANGANPLGTAVRTIAEPGYPAAIYEVVGVVADTKYSNLREETPPIAYVPVTQHPNLRPYPGLVVRSALPPQDLIAEVKRRVNDLSPDAVLGFTVFSAQMRERVVRERTLAWLAGALGVLATLMSTIGLYGVISYLTVRRRREIAIRRALGASRSTIVSLILSEVAVTLSVAIPLGVAASVAAVRGARGLLFGLSPHDPQTLAASAALLALVAVVASAIPAIRATQIDPTEALRTD
jgi:hypothetical protein